MKTSAFFIASSSDETSRLSVANSRLASSKPARSERITPLLSVITIFSLRAPNDAYRRVHDIAAAPAPQTTILTSSIFFFCNSSAFNNAAAEMMAVPCWSSCITGILSSSFKRRSISKHSGAFISSRFTPPKVGSSAFTVLTNSSTSVTFNSMSKTSISAKILNSTPLPSITGLPASGPIFPRPKTAVPLLITATRFPLAVYL
ncbi:hypothetical protein D3C80_1433230 [compost metagenome]